MEKKKVAIVTLGDSRREFYKKREKMCIRDRHHIMEDEIDDRFDCCEVKE